MKKSKSILLHFDGTEDLLYGIDALQHHKIPICEVYMPGRIPGLEAKLRIKNIRLGYTVLKYGCLGGTAFTTLAHYIFEQDSIMKSGGKSIFALLLNVFIMLITFFFATRLFPGSAPKMIKLKRNDHRHLIVVDANSITPNEDITHLFKYAGAVEISSAIKNMITA